jgi:hypothetical protein
VTRLDFDGAHYADDFSEHCGIGTAFILQSDCRDDPQTCIQKRVVGGVAFGWHDPVYWLAGVVGWWRQLNSGDEIR